MLKETKYQHASNRDFIILESGYRGTIMKRKVIEALFINELKPTFNIQGNSAPLKLY